MSMHNPPHPGEFINKTYIEPYDTSMRSLADSLGVSPSTINRIINGQSAISPKQDIDLKDVKKMKFKAA